MGVKPRRPLASDLDAALAARPVDVTLPRERLSVQGLVSAKWVADRLGVKEEWVNRHWRTLPYARRLSERVIRYDPVHFWRHLDDLAKAQGQR